jgi:rubrerythrin
LTKEEAIVILCIFGGIMVIPLLISLLGKALAKGITAATKKRDNQAAIKLIKKYIPDFDKDKFLQEQYKNYCDMQVAWMNFKLPDVKELLSDELYTMWTSQLDTLELKGEQNVMSSFKFVSAYITDASIENGNLTVATDYTIKARDYIVKKGTDKVIRGNKRLMEINNVMKYRVSVDHMNQIDKCPSCGNVITNNTSNVCPFCRSTLFVEHKKWVLTEMTCIGQK